MPTPPPPPGFVLEQPEPPPGFTLDTQEVRTQAYQRRVVDLHDRVAAYRKDSTLKSKFVHDYWRQQGEALRQSNPDFRDFPVEVAVQHLFQTVPAETRQSTRDRLSGDWEDAAEDKAIREFYQQREQIATAVWQNYRVKYPNADEQSALGAVHRVLAQQGFQPPGAGQLPPLKFAGDLLETDYTLGWTEAKNVVRGIPRGILRVATAPKRLGTAVGEAITDTVYQVRKGAEVTGSNVYRDIRKRTDIRREQVGKFFKGEQVPYLPKDFDLWGILGEQTAQFGVTAGGALAARAGQQIAGNIAAIAGMFALEGAGAFDTYMEYARQKGLDPRSASDEALLGAVTYAAIASALERIGPFELIQKQTPQVFSRLTVAAIGALTEGGTEFSQAMTQEAIAHGIDFRDLDWQSVENATKEALAGAIGGGAIMSVAYSGPIRSKAPPGEVEPPQLGMPIYEPTPEQIQMTPSQFETARRAGLERMTPSQAEVARQEGPPEEAAEIPQVKPEEAPISVTIPGGAVLPSIEQSEDRDSLHSPREVAIPGDGTAAVAADLAEGARRLLADDEGFWDPEATGRVIAGGIRTTSDEAGKLFTGLAALTDETEILRRTGPGSLAVEIVDGAISRARGTIGKHLTRFNRAWTALTKGSRSWLKTIGEDGETNWQALLEHPERFEDVPNDVAAAVEAYRGMQSDLGDQAVDARLLQRKRKGGLGAFAKAATGRYFRIFTPEGSEALRYQRGPTWDALMQWLADHPDRNPDLPADEATLKEQLTGERRSGETKKAGSLEFTRLFTELPTYLLVGDRWIAFQEARPQNHFRAALESQARRVAFWATAQDRLLLQYGSVSKKTGEVEFPHPKAADVTDVDGLVDSLRRDTTAAAKNPRGAERAYNRLLENYFRQHQGGVMEEIHSIAGDSKLAAAAAIVDRNLMASVLSFSGLWDIFQPTAAAHIVGLRKLGKAYLSTMADVLTGGEAAAEYHALGAVMDAHHDWSVRSDRIFRDLLGKNLPQAQMYLAQKFETWAQTVTATAFDRWAEGVNGRLKDREARMLRKHLRLTDDEVLAVARGEMTPEIRAKIIQNGVKTTNYLAEDPHRRGLLRNEPMLRWLIPFTSVMNGSIRAVGRTVTDITDDIGRAAKGDRRAWTDLLHSGGRLMAFLVLAFGRGLIQNLLRRLITGRPLVDPLDPDKWHAVALEALGEGAVFGPYYRIVEAAKYSGGDPNRFVVNMLPRVAILLEVITATWGVGKYEGSPWTDRLERAGLRFSPAARTMRNWYDRFVYPQRAEYSLVRKQVMAFNRDRDIPQTFGTGPRNPLYYRVFEAIRDQNRAALDTAIGAYKAWAKDEGLSSEDARSRLRSSLQSRRPVNLSKENREAFLEQLDPFDRQRAERQNAEYAKWVNEVTRRPGVKPKRPRPPRPPQPEKGGDWYAE